MAKEWIAVLRAADAAARWHMHQRRKGAAEEPYVNHLLEVAALVAEATQGEDPELVIAALLHDAIEDQKVPRAVIADAFGEGVAKLVEEVTDDRTLLKEERKRLQVEKASKESPRAKVFKLADKTSNLRAIAASPPANWPGERRLEYVKWARDVAKGLRGVSDWLEGEFEQAANEAERSIVPPPVKTAPQVPPWPTWNQASKELRDKIVQRFGDLQLGPADFLASRGFTVEDGFIGPPDNHTLQVDEIECIEFLTHEWGFRWYPPRDEELTPAQREGVDRLLQEIKDRDRPKK
jgi:hypothetical protein